MAALGSAYRAAFKKYLRHEALTEEEQRVLDQGIELNRTRSFFTESEVAALEAWADGFTAALGITD